MSTKKDPLRPFSAKAKSLAKGDVYEHYSGRRYTICHVARHSETLDEMVVYQALYAECAIWVRPLDMFFENVLVDGILKPRFTHVL